ncbi:VOC family protein [Halococcoides cellulosivorans]|uniref:Glyoxalase n=1 Tax=Halococcoides cellulosivorans TaxID=1679096 RepID=A0A2R4X3A9_9EURY|nr:VOC family protein [Halococcoides cellulosivorans]AWB28285.1 glyoxalase [Halococcoides cellulosivorans]
MDGTVDHVMLRVEDLDAALEFYTDHFGYEERSRWEAETFTNVHLGPPEAHPDSATVELTYNHDGRSYTFGDSWGHVALRVADVHEAYDDLMAQGVEDYRDPGSCGGEYAFVRDPDGHEIELVERDHGARYSVDHVMVRVEDAARSIGWYVRALEYDLVRRSEHSDFALYFLKPGDSAPEATSLELTYNYDGRSYGMGDAWGHVAVRTPEGTLTDTWETLLERDAEDYRDPESCGYDYAFTKDPDGHEIELVER